MKRIPSLLLVFSFLLLTHPARSLSQTTSAPKSDSAKDAPLPSADELAQKCAKGNGGREAWAKLSTLVMSGTMEVPAAGLSGTIEIYAKAPNKVLGIVSFAEGKFVQKEAFDGQAGWKSDPQSGLKKLEGAELETAKVESLFDTEVRLKEIYPDMKVTGRTKVGEQDAYTAVAHEPGGKVVTFYFDAQSGLRIAEDSESPGENGQTQKAKIYFEDYRSLGGVQVPYQIRGDAAGFTFAIHVKEGRYNTPVDDAMFAMPAASSPASAPQ